MATFLAISGLAWFANRPGMSLIYGGLDPAQAGDVIAGIERAGVAYEVKGDAIWVDSAHRDRLRMDLAAQGLPAPSSTGYELLDGLSGFGTTSQMFDAAYWRAKEGELARTILSHPNVKAARVHLAVESGRGYRRDATSTASVTLTTAGQAVTREQAAALKYLVSSGVPGLAPDAVAVIDTQRGIVAATEEQSGSDRAAEMKRNVERILEPHVGPGNAIVELNLDIVTDSELLTEQRFDPEQRALISQLTEETSDQSNSTGSGAVTAASNLPDAQQQAGDSSRSARSENRQQANYEVSRLTREVTRQPGATRRLSVAVLVNGVAEADAQGGSTLVTRSEAELQTLRELVASAVGFDEARGDQITVKSLPFAAFSADGMSGPPALLERLDLGSLLRILLVGFFALAFVMLVLRPMLRARAGDAAEQPAAGALPQLDSSRPPLPALGGLDGPVLGGLDGLIDNGETPLGAEPFFFQPAPMGADPLALPSADPVSRLRSLMRERHEESVKILSGWIANKENAN